MGHMYDAVGRCPKAYVSVLASWRVIYVTYHIIFIIIMKGINFRAKSNNHLRGN